MYLEGTKESVLKLLTDIAEGIAVMFGKNCETLIHDLSQPGYPILVIFNNHVSGRDVGSTVDISGDPNAHVSDMDISKHYINHLVTRKNGHRIKSTTFNIEGDDFCYGLGINFDFTPIAEANFFFQDFIATDNFLSSAILHAKKDRVDDIFERCVALIGLPLSEMKTPQRKELVRLLYDNHFFNYQKSIPYVSEKLNISRYTVYNYLKALREQSQD